MPSLLLRRLRLRLLLLLLHLRLSQTTTVRVHLRWEPNINITNNNSESILESHITTTMHVRVHWRWECAKQTTVRTTPRKTVRVHTRWECAKQEQQQQQHVRVHCEISGNLPTTTAYRVTVHFKRWESNIAVRSVWPWAAVILCAAFWPTLC